ncbi:kinesin-like protein KIF18A isoform X2 [Stegostoma tigrinum]|uniref:kinesin-like protein KIF18A isoform X2 n=1 Tax=Stegostoma tigrinum TaxID=3053191 RepID=UPI00286FCDC5|nr:kinesin-like protein KIF18A isoform X2 [Stegostoma tigrinum]
MHPTENGACNHVKVFIRVRPENAREQNESHHKVVHVVDRHMLLFDPKEEEINYSYGCKVRHRDLNKRKSKDLQFVFDRVFGSDSSQLDVFEETKSILESVFNGYNCTVFAYGATGSGKTHTMLGSAGQPGVMYRTMKELYNRIEQVKDEKCCDVAVSYLEVYNEEVRDLLTNSRSLAVREDAQGGIIVQGLTLHKPTSSKQLLQMLDYGNKNRTQHPTDVNSNSSRSHAVFQIYLRQQDRTASIHQNIKIAKMCLVDLAGSERISAMNMKEARFREGANINRSLLALGNVINALADSKKKIQHIPYRNSKLTRLLKDSLGGNCQTVMIAAISPSSLSYDDTYNTLKYANRAKDIKSSVRSNILNLNNHVGKYAKICEEQRKEIMELKEKLKAYESEKLLFLNNHGRDVIFASNSKETEIKRFEGVLENIFSKRRKIRVTCLDLELRLKEMELKMYYYKRHQQYATLFSCDHVTAKASCKHERRLASLITQHKHIQQKLETVEKMLEENSNWLHRVENEMCLFSQDGTMPQVLNQDLQCSHLKMEVMDLKRQIQHMKQLFSLQKPENRRTEKLINALLPAFRQQYQMLKEAGLASTAVEGTFVQMEQLIHQEKGIAWEDQIIELPEIIPDEQLNISSIMNYSQLTYCQATPCRSPSRSLQVTAKKVKNGRSPDQFKSSRGSPGIQQHNVQNLQPSSLVVLKTRRTADTVNQEQKQSCWKSSTDSKENQQPMGKEGTASTYKSSRRRLEQALLTGNDPDKNATQNSSFIQLDDSLSKEGFALIDYTPESYKSQIVQVQCQLPTSELELQKANCHRRDKRENLSDTEDTAPGLSENPVNVTYSLEEHSESATQSKTQHSFVNKISCNKTVTGYSASFKHSKNQRTILQRLGLPSLLSSNGTNNKPSYMALTSAARRKRRSESFMGKAGDNIGPLPEKRVCQDLLPIIGNKPTQLLLPGRSHSHREAKKKRILKGDSTYKGLSSNKGKGRHFKSLQHI